MTKKRRSLIDIFAFLISAFFSPYITATVFIVVIIYNSSHDIREFLPWMVTFLLFSLIIPGIFVLWRMEVGLVHDLHIADKNERKAPFLVAGISAIIGLVILLLMHAAHPVIVVAVAYAANTVLIAIITQYWKISIHTALFSSVATIAVILYGATFWWLYLILIPLSWSRVHRKRHTPLQAAAGAMLAFIGTVAVFWAFGYL